jgi:hypothetical protein
MGSIPADMKLTETHRPLFFWGLANIELHTGGSTYSILFAALALPRLCDFIIVAYQYWIFHRTQRYHLPLNSCSLHLIPDPVTLLVGKRMRGERTALGPFNLGRFGLAASVFAIVYGIFTISFYLFRLFGRLQAQT